MKGSTTPGQMVRQYASVDAGALMDIGYGNIQSNAPPELSCTDPTVSTDALVCSADVACDTVASCTDPDGDPVSLDCLPTAPYSLGETGVTVTCDDGTESAVADCTVTVEDTTPPIVQCNAPATMTPREAPMAFTATHTDNCDAEATLEIVGFDCFAFTGSGKRIDKTESCIVEVAGDTVTILDSGGVGDTITWTISAIDSCGNTSETVCEVAVDHPVKGP
jgi:hypothetical protein